MFYSIAIGVLGLSLGGIAESECTVRYYTKVKTMRKSATPTSIVLV